LGEGLYSSQSPTISSSLLSTIILTSLLSNRKTYHRPQLPRISLSPFLHHHMTLLQFLWFSQWREDLWWKIKTKYFSRRLHLDYSKVWKVLAVLETKDIDLMITWRIIHMNNCYRTIMSAINMEFRFSVPVYSWTLKNRHLFIDLILWQTPQSYSKLHCRSCMESCHV
jgi:hypothetical protein